MSTAKLHGTARPRGSYRLMFDARYGVYFWTNTCAATGLWIFSIVTAILAYELTDSASVVALVVVAQNVPQIFSLLSGKLADRRHLGRLIALGRLVSAVGPLTMAIWLWAFDPVGSVEGTVLMCVSAALMGFGLVLVGPASQTMIPLLIRPGEMPAAMALSSVPMTLSRAIGPAAGAFLALHLGPVAALLVAAAGYLIHAVAVLTLQVRRATTPVGTDIDDLSVTASLRYVRDHAPLPALLLAVAAIGVAAEPSVTLSPTIAADLGGGSALAGWLTSGFGIGACVGFLLFGVIRRWVSMQRLTGASMLLMAVGLLALAVAWIPPVALGAFGLSGIGMTLAFICVTTLIQEKASDSVRGRVMALWFLAFLGVRPIATTATGVLADTAGLPTSLIVAAVVIAGAAYLCRPAVLGPDSSPAT
ncbi:MFS transporter [Streptosporangium sp. NPDC049078]|uniref:MFS transporter n=1 Tax=Streptosporangium sp. NPDC049078 TaxID=3155767 RepID=UPI00343F0DAF